MRSLSLCRYVSLGLLAVALWGLAAPAPAANPLERFADPLPSPKRVSLADEGPLVRSGEVVVLTGSADGVFEQQQGWLESLLASAAKNQQPIFRNMCWEGDTVYEQWRPMNFGAWGEQFDAVGASLIVTWFGQVETLDDAHTADDFAAAYGKLLDEFQKTTPRIVVVGPPAFEKPASRWVRDNTPRNERVRQFAAIAKKLADERHLTFVDLIAPLANRAADAPRLTSDGMHFTPEGQRKVSEAIASQLLAAPAHWSAELEPLRIEIVTKNRLWFDCWRTMNWYFSYGDRTNNAFDKPSAGRPSLDKELEQYKPLLRLADARVHAVALGQQPPEMPPATPEPPQKRIAPEEEQATFKLRDGFEVNLFASEADGLIKPIQICWDERGRLWALCAPSYPQLVPGVPADDFVLVCEDTNADGRADKFHKYATGLVMPTGLALGDGGVYVCQGTQLLHLTDTDGDERADHSRVVFSGFGTGDSHQCINALAWGPDGRLWFTQGLHNFALVETPYGLVRCHKAGVWRLNPRSLELHHFLSNASASENAWGVGWDAWGQTFYTPGNEPGAYYIEPALQRTTGEKPAEGHYRGLGKLAISKSKGMNTEFLSGRHLPDELQGACTKSVYIAGYVELHRFIDNGSGFAAEPLGELIYSPSNFFRPLETKVGPDGAIYVCDWSNPVIGHYQASYRDPQRDHTHGRVWRLTFKDRPLTKAPALAELPAEQLIDQMLSPERWVAEQARRLLSSRPTEQVLPPLDARLAATPDDAPEAARLLFASTAIYAAHESVRPELIGRMLASAEPKLRAFGTHMIGLWADRLSDPVALLRQAAADEHPRVRLEAIVAASYVPAPAALEAAAVALDKPRDKFIDYALAQTARVLKPQWYPALERGELRFDNHPDRLRLVLEADGTKDVAGFVRNLAGNAQLDAAAREKLASLLVNVGTSEDLRFAIEQQPRSLEVLAALTAAAQVHRKMPSGELAPLIEPLIADADPALQVAGLRLAGVWKTTTLAAQVRTKLEQAKSPAITAAAIAAVGAIDGPTAVPLLASRATTDQPLEVRVAAVTAIGAVDLETAARLAAELLTATDSTAASASEAAVQQLIMPLLERRGGSAALAKALAQVKLSPDAAKLIGRVLNAAGQADPGLVDVVNQAIGVRREKIVYDPQQVKELAAAAAGGDAANGRRVFLSKLANCTACHKVAGQGGDIGPDLTNVGKGLSPELLIESVLWPNRQVKEGYMAIRVITDSGQVVTGYRLKETSDELQLRDTSTGEVRRFARSEIDELANAGSVMPEGLTAGMTAAEVRDLVRYLSELGKNVPGRQ